MGVPTIRVSGQAVVPGRPDEVEISLDLTTVRSTPESALQQLAEQSDSLDSVFEQFQSSGLRINTSGATVEEEREYEDGKYRHLGYRASKRVRARVEDASIVGHIMNQATSAAKAEISGPRWRISLENPARFRACGEAAAHAKTKAEAYAQALGLRLGLVESVNEPGLNGETGRSRGHEANVMLMEDADVSPHALSVRADELDVSAEVEVEFRLEQP